MKRKPKIWISEVKKVIANGNTEKAIQIFFQEIEKDEKFRNIRNELSLISNKFNEFKKKERIGILPLNDNTHEIVNSNLINLVDEVEKSIFQNSQEYENLIKKLWGKLFLAKSPEELERIKFEAEKEKRKNPDDYDAYQIHKMASGSFEWEKSREIRQHHSGQGDNVSANKKHDSGGDGGFGCILILVIVLIIWGIIELIKWIF